MFRLDLLVFVAIVKVYNLYEDLGIASLNVNYSVRAGLIKLNDIITMTLNIVQLKVFFKNLFPMCTKRNI